MTIQKSDFKLDWSPLAQSRLLLQGWTTFSIGDVATVSLVVIDKTLIVENLFVVEPKRRQGLGTQIFKILEDGAKYSGFLLLGLGIDTRQADAKGALAFARSLGLRLQAYETMYTIYSKSITSPEQSTDSTPASTELQA